MSIKSLHNEPELLKRIAKGDEQAFTLLFRHYSLSLGLLVDKILADEAARQDVLQEVFIKLWLHRDQLPQVQFLTAWLKKITVNEALLYLRKNAAYDKRLSALQLSSGHIEKTASQNLDWKEMQAQVQALLQQMPEQRRIIYELNRGEGLSAKEIALRLNLSYGHVRNELSAVIKQLRDQLGTSLVILLFMIIFFF